MISIDRKETAMTVLPVSGRIGALSILGAIAFAGAAAAQSAPCPGNATSISGSLQCSCPAGAATGSVWGTGIYTSDSNICSAAVHAGAIGTGGGQVVVTMGGRQESYTGSTQYGVTSSNWGAWDNSFTVSRASMALPACGTMPAGADLHDCACPAGPYGGSAWGSDPYTNDSNICTAAQHSGVIGAAGGMVRVLAAPGLQSYRGSEWNGVVTSDYGPWSGSITFDRN
jgi:hypothetical protein